MIWIDCGCFGGGGVEAEMEKEPTSDSSLKGREGGWEYWEVEEMMMRWY